jgi:hypothetical protein
MENPPTAAPRSTVSGAGSRMDKSRKKLLETIFYMLAFIAVTAVAYVRYDYNSSILFAGSLALTFFVAAEIVLTR